MAELTIRERDAAGGDGGRWAVPGHAPVAVIEGHPARLAPPAALPDLPYPPHVGRRQIHCHMVRNRRIHVREVPNCIPYSPGIAGLNAWQLDWSFCRDEYQAAAALGHPELL